ncbi:MAG: hypothetical protein J6B98_01445 [Bacilli bacterium]|nr:hypothetical protein [Bacilli bacterium]
MGDFFITDLLRNIFFGLDKIVYWFIQVVYTIFMEIANTTIFSNEIFNEFENKVYALLGIFMLFKVSFSVLSYIVNPDEFTDKSKGMNKLITNILISLVLIIGVPIIFTQAMEIQQIILKDDVIPKLFSSAEAQIYISSQDSDDGSDMALWAFSAFYSPETDFNSLSEIFRDDVNRRNANETDYAVEYYWFLSTVAGVVIALLLISFCFDVALRSIKLGFLQMIAPIPIISRIDPKKGNEIFNKWVKNCISTYLDLFIRLAGIFFAIYIIKLIKQSGFTDVVTGESATHTYTKLTFVFIIMGALMFAKQLPKLIKDITGFDMGGGNFTLNPWKKINQVPLVGKAASLLTAAAGGAIAGYRPGKEAGSVGRGMLQGAWGATTAAWGKAPLMGGDGKNSMPGFMAGIHSGYKSVKGKDYEIPNLLKNDKLFGNGKQRVDNLKDKKNKLLGQQSELDAQLEGFYEQYRNAATDADREKIRGWISDNRAKYGKIGKYVSTIDDQISDIKLLYHFDESRKEDIKDAIAAADAGVELTSTTPLSSETASRSSSNSNSSNSSSGGATQNNTGSSGTSGTNQTNSSSSSSGGAAPNNTSSYGKNNANQTNSSSSSSGGATPNYTSSYGTSDTNQTNSSSSSSDGAAPNNTSSYGTNDTNQTNSSSSSSGGASSNKTESYTTNNTNSSKTNSQSRTETQERVEKAANYHEAPTREEHNEKQDYYTRFFNDTAVSNAVDANERYDDQRKAKIVAKIKENNEYIEEWTQALKDPNIKIGDRQQYKKEIERLEKENASLQKYINDYKN